jgi:uncharacterized protein YeaO (DUF488 family)
MATDNDALKVLVDDALSRGVHADHERVLTEWRKDNTSDEERRAALTDDERAAEDAKRAEDNANRPEPTARSGSRSR